MTPKLWECIRAAARARRNVEAANVEVEAARQAMRGTLDPIVLVRAKSRLNDARLTLATALDLFNERNDELALALFDEVGLPPASADLPAELRSRLAVVPGGRR